jgi:hypothetical protein
MSRAEHLAWCKERALEYLPTDPENAVASMMSDMSKHEETNHHAGVELGMQLLLNGHLNSADSVRRWITGFN